MLFVVLLNPHPVPAVQSRALSELTNAVNNVLCESDQVRRETMGEADSREKIQTIIIYDLLSSLYIYIIQFH
jgi:hypothetical protein